MSLNQGQNKAEQTGQTKRNRKRGVSSDQMRRMTSITRRMHWYLLRGKIARFLGTDFLLAALLTIGWCADQEYSKLGRIPSDCQRHFDSLEVTADPGIDLIYNVVSKDNRDIEKIFEKYSDKIKVNFKNKQFLEKI